MITRVAIRRFGRVVALLLAVTAAAQAAEARSFIWKVSRGSQTVYLVGSVHLLTEDFYPLNPVLDTAFNDSTLLVEEVDLGQMLSPESQMSVLMRGRLPAGQTIEGVLSPATYADVSKRIAEIGLPLEPLKQFKPWMLALTLVGFEWQKAGFEAELGLDKHFYDLAQSASKPVKGLETVDYQISRFDEMPLSEQDKLLAETLRDADSEQANLTKIAQAWKSGDAATIERLMIEDIKSNKLMYDRLLVERNRAWLPQIEALFSRPGHTFVVVGAAHLVGPDGLLAMLRAKGYAVEQM